MRLGRVVGRVWASVKADQFEGVKLLLVQPITAEGSDTGRPLVAVDAVGAGAGETIYWCRGREASLALLPAEAGADAAVVGVVDAVEVTPER